MVPTCSSRHNWIFFFFSSRRRHTRWTGDWSSDVCSSDLVRETLEGRRVAVVDDSIVRGTTSRKIVKRSEERRVGKECRSWGSPYHYKKNEKTMSHRIVINVQRVTSLQNARVGYTTVYFTS